MPSRIVREPRANLSAEPTWKLASLLLQTHSQPHQIAFERKDLQGNDSLYLNSSSVVFEFLVEQSSLRGGLTRLRDLKNYQGNKRSLDSRLQC